MRIYIYAYVAEASLASLIFKIPLLVFCHPTMCSTIFNIDHS